jgi:hypothetical protein
MLKRIASLLALICLSCVPVQQQFADSENSQIEGYIGPLIKDANEFKRVALFHSDLVIDYNGKTVPMVNCNCFSRPKIAVDKLFVSHSYGGGESNRESTKLYWNGTYHQDARGNYIVDVILHSDKVDIRRAMIYDRKIHTIEALQRSDVNTIWINLVGYEQLIRYDYQRNE